MDRLTTIFVVVFVLNCFLVHADIFQSESLPAGGLVGGEQQKSGLMPMLKKFPKEHRVRVEKKDKEEDDETTTTSENEVKDETETTADEDRDNAEEPKKDSKKKIPEKDKKNKKGSKKSNKKQAATTTQEASETTTLTEGIKSKAEKEVATKKKPAQGDQEEEEEETTAKDTSTAAQEEEENDGTTTSNAISGGGAAARKDQSGIPEKRPADEKSFQAFESHWPEEVEVTTFAHEHAPMAHQARSRFYSAMMRQQGNGQDPPSAQDSTSGSSVPSGNQGGEANATVPVNTSPSPAPTPTPAPAPPADKKEPPKDHVECTNKKNETVHCPKNNPKCCNSAYCILQQYNVLAFMFGMTLIELVMN